MTTRLLLETINDIIHEDSIESLLKKLPSNLKWLFDFDRLTLAHVNSSNGYDLHVLFDVAEINHAIPVLYHIPMNSGINGFIFNKPTITQFNPAHPYDKTEPLIDNKIESGEYKNVIAFPFKPPDKPLAGVLILASNKNQAYSNLEIEYINFICSHIGLALERIQSVNKLNNEIEHRKIVQNNLQLAKEKAERAEQAKTEFLSRMSHELRTPLNAILGFSQIQKNCINKNKFDNMMKHTLSIIDASRYLLRLVDDVLDITEVEQGEITSKLENCSLNSIIASSIELVAKQAKLAQVNIDYSGLTQTVSANADHLKQVFVNLLGNGIKFNKKGGNIKVHASSTQDGHVKVYFIDSGVGIKESDQKLIFEPFTRLKYANDNEIEGVGIGLTVCQLFVAQMKGLLNVHSVYGEGCTFTIRLLAGK